MAPTLDQLASRKALNDFVERVRPTLRAIGSKVKSALYGRPDDELKGWIDRGRAIAEIEDSLGYRLIVETTAREIEWAREQLEIGKLDAGELRGYLKSLRFMEDFIITTRRNADIASSILAGRDAEIGRGTTTFIKNATVRQ